MDGSRRGSSGGRFSARGHSRGGATVAGHNKSDAGFNIHSNGQSKSSLIEDDSMETRRRGKLSGHWWIECKGRVIPNKRQAAAAAGSRGASQSERFP